MCSMSDEEMDLASLFLFRVLRIKGREEEDEDFLSRHASSIGLSVDGQSPLFDRHHVHIDDDDERSIAQVTFHSVCSKIIVLPEMRKFSDELRERENERIREFFLSLVHSRRERRETASN